MARIVLIDDDQMNLEFMRQYMQIEGHEFAWAPDGQQGLALVRQFKPQLVICDVIMPHLGGYAVLETLRADPNFADVPVLLFSAAMDDEARAIALNRGATEALAKPFDLEQLRDAVTRCLRQVRR